MAVKIHLKHKELFVGTFVALAAVIGLWFVVQIMLKQDFFAATANLKAFFQNTNNIAGGSKVCIKGITVGTVKKVTLNPENRIEVVFSVKEKYLDKIRRDSRITVGRENPMMPISDPILEIVPGSLEQPAVREGDTVLTGRELDLASLINTGAKIVSDMAEGKGLIGQVLTNDSLGPQLVRLLNDMETLLDQANRMAGKGDHVLDDAGTTMRTVKDATDELKPLLAGVPALMAKVDSLLSSAQPLPAETKDLLKKINTLMSNLTQEQGVLNQVMQDKQIYPQLRQIVNKLDSLITTIEMGNLKVKVKLF